MKKIKDKFQIKIEEVKVAEEKVVFKLPKRTKLMAVYTKLDQSSIEKILANYKLGSLDNFEKGSKKKLKIRIIFYQ